MKNIIDFYSKFETKENLKYKRELLNMKLNLSILNNEDEKQILYLRREIRRLTKIIEDDYLDAYERIEENIKETISDILSKEVTEENAYTHAQEIEEFILNQDYPINENDFENELIILYYSYEQLGYYPHNLKKGFSTIKHDTIEKNKKDYINQVLYSLLAKDNNKNNISILKLLREEIIIKTKERSIYKIKTKQFRLV